MSDTIMQEPRSNGATPLERLVRMLQSTLPSYPQARLVRGQDAFGVWWGDNRSLYIRYSGDWSDADLRDSLVLFAAWLVADAAYLRSGEGRLSGLFAEVLTRSDPSSGRTT